jgi:thioredoxin 2
MAGGDAVVLVCAACGTLNRVPRARLRDRPICADCRAPLVSGPPPELDAASFERLSTRSDLPVVIDFWAPWCGPCRMMAPAFATARDACADVAVLAKLDTEQHQAVAGRLGIRSIPTVIAFHRGRELARQSGAMQAAQIEQWVRSVARVD